jgi:CubicO group peptidase (beta-lactamase class C family)
MIDSDGQLNVRGARIARISLFVALCVWLLAAAFAEDAKVSAEKRALLEDTVSKFMASTNAPGIAVAVVLNGEEVWSEGFGMADLENNVPVTTQALFRLASIEAHHSNRGHATLGTRQARS